MDLKTKLLYLIAVAIAKIMMPKAKMPNLLSKNISVEEIVKQTEELRIYSESTEAEEGIRVFAEKLKKVIKAVAAIFMWTFLAILVISVYWLIMVVFFGYRWV